MRNISGFIALLALAACLLLAGRASATDGHQCGTTSLPVVQNTVWRMEVGVDEAAFSGPSIHDRLIYNWSDEAKRTYRWTSTAMPVDAGTSTELMTVSAAVIGDDVPVLAKGDIVDVYVASHEIDYSRGRAPVVVRRVCAARDERCMNEVRRRQEGRVAGVEVKGVYPLAGDKKLSSLLANLGCTSPQVSCSGDAAAVSR